MRLDDSTAERLRSIIRSFDAEGAGVSITIEDLDGTIVASAGRLAAGAAAPTEVRLAISADGEVIGHVMGRGSVERSLMAAVVAGISASAEALIDVSSGDAARHRIDAELMLARRIQRSFVPLVPPDIPGYDVAGFYEAAREVGGDFFDVFRPRGRRGRLAITVADVSGKGIAAALLMAFARPILHAAADHATSPSDALERTNRVLVEERRSTLFITAICAFVELRTGLVRLASAGHEPPLLVRAGDEPVTWIESAGPLLGAFRRLDLVEESLVLAPGDLVLFYTDGVTDAQTSTGERFGDARLLETVRTARGGTAGEVVVAVSDAYHAFQGDMPVADDVTIVAIRRIPARRDGTRARGR